MDISRNTELRFNEDYSLWVETKVENQIEIENWNFNLPTYNYLAKLGILFVSVIVILPEIGMGVENEYTGIRVSRYGKEIPNFFKHTEEKIVSKNNLGSINRIQVFAILMSILSSFNNLKQEQTFLKYVQLEQLKKIQNRKIIESVVLTGGQVIGVVSLLSYSFILISILLSVYLGRKKEIREELRTFGRRNTILAIIQLASLICSVLIADSKSGVEHLKHLALHPVTKWFLTNALQYLLISLIICISGYYTFLPGFSNSRPFVDMVLDFLDSFVDTYVHQDPEYKNRLAELRKKIAIAKVIQARRKREDKVLPPEHFIEKTYQRKIDVAIEFERDRRLRIAEMLLNKVNESLSEDKKNSTDEE